MEQIPTFDVIAITSFLAAMVGYSFVTRNTALADRGIMAAIHAQRKNWIQMMSRRDVRIMDVQLLAVLSNANTFFASTSVIVIGGMAAGFASGDALKSEFETLPFVSQSTPFLWHMKWLVLIGLFVFAFFKFAWAYRLTHYTGIMIGATPEPRADDPRARDDHIEHTAELAGLAAEHSNSGLRTYYFGIAAIGWFLHPAALIIATIWVLAILIRREFWSTSLKVISGK